MEVDQMLRITAQDALWHEWWVAHTRTHFFPFHQRETSVTSVILLPVPVRISGNGASEKNLKDGVCAQFEKNFAKAKWRVSSSRSKVTIITPKSKYNCRRCGGKEERMGNMKLRRRIHTNRDKNVPIEDNDDWFICHHRSIMRCYPNVQLSTEPFFSFCRYYKRQMVWKKEAIMNNDDIGFFDDE